MAFESVVRKPVYSQVADQLREAILSGELAADSALPSERELSASFGVGRTTVREAMRALEAQGLVITDGATAPFRVAAPEEMSTGPVRRALVQLLQLGQIPLRDLVEVRSALESAVVWHAANRGTDFGEASAAVEAMDGGDVDLKSFEEADVRFHLALASASGNVALELIMLGVRDSIAAHLQSGLAALPEPRKTLQRLTREHAEILTAVEAGAGDRAAELVRSHIFGFYRDAMEDPEPEHSSN